MDSDLFEKLLKEAIEEREKRAPVKSIGLFKNVYEQAKNIDQKLMVLNHLGLAFFHTAWSYEKSDLSKFEEYMICSHGTFNVAYEKASSIADGLDHRDQEAIALRNLSRPEFAAYETDGLHTCALFALKACMLAKECMLKDQVWFTHGRITVLIELAKSRGEEISTKEIKRLVRREAAQWFWLTGGEPKLNRQVWLLGLLEDVAKVYPNLVTYKRLMKMWYYAKKNGLERRAEQLSKFILELYPQQPA